jgi:protoporphyrinogen oxidase
LRQNIAVAVIGAGPAGLTAAFKLQEAGFNVTLFESAPRVGGMARSFDLWGQIVDVGPHRFFSNDPRVNKFWLEAVDSEYTMVKRLTRIYYKNKFFSYPIQASNALKGLGMVEALICVLSFIKAKIFPIKDESKFDSWVINRFGNRLFQIFFKSYTEKLWGIKSSSLDADFAAQRIKKLSLYEAVKSALVGDKGNKHRTLVDEFAYPTKGAGHVYNKLAMKFQSLGGTLLLETSVESVIPSKSKVVITYSSSQQKEFGHVISTMPLTHLMNSIGAPIDILKKSKGLKFRNTILVYLQVEGGNPFPDQWIYVHAENLQTGRITNFRNWAETINQGRNEHIICLEYWCYDYDANWKSDDEYLIDLGTRELYSTGLVASGSILKGKVVRVPKCYPVYSSGYKDDLIPVQNYLNSIDLVTPIGRYGSFKYNNQDHSILMGLLAAENITRDAKHDLWKINTDYEYQEIAKITSTGLVNG